MAWTNSVIQQTIIGNMRMTVLSCTADSAESTIDSGLSKIFSYALGPSTMATAAITIFPNKGSTGTALAGFFGVSAAAANDVFYLTCFGV